MSARCGFAAPMLRGLAAPVRCGTAERVLRALGLAILLAAAGCASENARFYTELTQPGSLNAGAPVVNLGAPIGSVSRVWLLADGNTGVAFDVNRADADAIRRNSIMVLQNDPGGASLDVMTANPLSPPASPGTQIDGASNQNDANSLVAAENMAASAPAMAMMMSAPGNSAAAMNASPAWLQMQQQIAMLQSQLLIASVQNAGVAAQQLQQVNRNAAALERQLIAAGHSAQAEQLRRQVDALAHTLTTTPAGLSPPSTTSPRSKRPRTHRSTAPSASSSGTLVIPPVR
jgi:paraquat-inducible protein B